MATIISWTNETWNPTTGCTKVSPGCANCYAERLSLRFGWSSAPWTKGNELENVRLHPNRLDKPKKLKTPSRIFVNSMSDLFHERIPDSYISQVFEVMKECPQHTFQILTKRADRAASWPGPWEPNIWMGASVECERVLDRIDYLRRCGARVRFISFEPLIEDLPNLTLADIHWAIVGGESGPGYRPMDHTWARMIRDACLKSDCAFFFKQSAAPRTEMGTSLIHEDGSEWLWQQYPGSLTPPIMTKAADAK